MNRRLPTSRRLLRARSESRRPDHGVDLALPTLRSGPVDCGDNRGPASGLEHEQGRLLQSLTAENATLMRELGRVQRHATEWQTQWVARARHLEAQLLRARAACIVKDTQLAVLRDAAAAAASDESSLSGTTVLCLGGRARQVPLYRDLVERLGGRLLHARGSGDDCLHELAGLLRQADIVVVQAGYVCRGACAVVQAHCARHPIRCLWLDKPCALEFARCLTQA